MVLEEQTLETIRLSAKRGTQAQRVAGKIVVSLSSFSTPTSFPADRNQRVDGAILLRTNTEFCTSE